jgi:hypothetical protein
MLFGIRLSRGANAKKWIQLIVTQGSPASRGNPGLLWGLSSEQGFQFIFSFILKAVFVFPV